MITTGPPPKFNDGRDILHDTGRQVAIPRAPHLRGQSSTPLSARRHRGRAGAYPRVPDGSTPGTLRAIGRVTAPRMRLVPALLKGRG
jgi:hypothetical protein